MATEMAAGTVSGALDDLVDAERRRFEVPGCAVAVVRGDEVLVCRGFGHRDLAATLPVTDRTLFAIGSSSKAFTASLVGALVDDGLIEWDRPVRNYLPSLRLHDPVATELLTVRDMLAHRSGLPRHDLLWYGNQSLEREELVRRLQHLQPNRSFREVWQYNNLMYITAGWLAGTLVGCSWEEAVTRRLLEPLGMTNTNFNVEDSKRSPDHAKPHAPRKTGVEEVPFLGLDLAGPAGSINSCIADMARWVMCQVNGGVVDGREVITPAALKQLQAPAMVLPEDAAGALWPEAVNNAYAMGWFLQDYRGRKAVHHGGDVDGFATMVALLPNERIGVVVLCNMDPCGLRDALPYMIFDRLLGLEPLPWGERYKGMYDAMLGGFRAAAEHKTTSAPADAPKPSHPLEAYTGRYHNPGYGDIGITLEAGRLVPHYNDLDKLSMQHLRYDVFGLQLPEREIPPLDMVFETAADGSVAAVRIPFEVHVDPIVFRRQVDASLSDRAVLQRYAGRYEMAPLQMQVAVDRQGRLVAEITGQGRLVLDPTAPHTFSVAEMQAVTFEFTVDDGGAVTRVVVDPLGIWTRTGG